jgi:peptidoglycan LD-endopeptidase CwlK
MRDIKLLHPDLIELHAKFAYEMARAGLNYAITSTLRTYAQQEALFAQGRKPLDEVNALRVKAGMWKIGVRENANQVTWTMKSRHLPDNQGFGRAFDIVLIGLEGKTHYNEKISVNVNTVPDYYEAGVVGESVGLVWGGRFKNSAGQPRPDMPHYEMPR